MEVASMNRESITLDDLVGVLSQFTHTDGQLKNLCTSAEAKSLTFAQKKAMHVFVHEVLASVNRLYTQVPEDRVGAVINAALNAKGFSKPV
jgi:hypothetical protein